MTELRQCSSISLPHFQLQFCTQTFAAFFCRTAAWLLAQQAHMYSTCMPAISPNNIIRWPFLPCFISKSLMDSLSPPQTQRMEREMPRKSPCTTWSKLCAPRYILETETTTMKKAANMPYLSCFFLSKNQRMKTPMIAANSACPLGFPQSLGQQYPILRTLWCVQQGLGALQKDLLIVRKYVLKSVKMTVIKAVIFCLAKRMQRQAMEMMSMGSTSIVKKMKKQSSMGKEYCCIRMINATPMSQSGCEQCQFTQRFSGRHNATTNRTIFFSIPLLLCSTHLNPLCRQY